MSDEPGAESETPDETTLQDFKFVGPATAQTLRDADVAVEDVRDKRVSYRMLVDAGTNPGVATKIRREHSLPWSITGEENDDLDKRSDQVRGLRDEERAWVAASSGDWSASSSDDGRSATADGSGDAEMAEAAWQQRSKPTPVSELDGISQSEADRLSSAGINSVRSLATITPEHVADLLNLDESQVREWRDRAAKQA
jgi:predicted flap endonuclease-1-like 5' DNA nuclease